MDDQLAYFAAHAPDVPDWWPEGQTKVELTNPLFHGWDGLKLDRWRGWGDWLHDDQISPDELQEFQRTKAEYDAIKARNASALQSARLRRVCEWRWTFAAAMVATAPKD